MSDRPIECTGCKRAIKIIYKEIAGNAIATTTMCDECPVYQKKMGRCEHQGSPHAPHQSLCCDRCKTTLETLLTEGRLGCPSCYQVFESLILDELTKQDLLSPRLKNSLEVNRTTPLHFGQTPTAPSSIALSTQLKKLMEALNEALSKENYEEAAYLRDQIKEIMGRQDG